MTDYRVVWLRDRISKLLGVEEHPETVEELFREHYDKFYNFLEDEINNIDEMEKCILYIYRTFYDKLVEREVLTIEKGKIYKLSMLDHVKNINFVPFISSTKNYDTTTTSNH
jgi:hypothetical protein